MASGLGIGGFAQGDTLVNIDDLIGSAFGDILVGNTGFNRLFGGGGGDVLQGGDDNDLLFGEDGDDQLVGGEGNDTLVGGAGADELIGGEAGHDMVTYQESGAGVIVDLAGGTGSGGTAQGDTYDSIENALGSTHGDSLFGTDVTNLLNGLEGNDNLKGFGGSDTLFGDLGDDVLKGGGGATSSSAEKASTTWPETRTTIFSSGEGGADTMAGGAGDDRMRVDNVGDVVNEAIGGGSDTVLTSVSYSLASGSEVEVLEVEIASSTTAIDLTGNNFANQITGNNGDNQINGGAGADQMSGRGGNDIYFVDNAGDSVAENGGQGADEVRTSVSFTLTAGADVEVLRTIDDDGVAAINLTGNGSGNLVRGNNGANVINGGAGNDELTGRGGQDAFLFDTALDAATNVDVIVDFSVADDTIRLDNAVFNVFAQRHARGRTVRGRPGGARSQRQHHLRQRHRRPVVRRGRKRRGRRGAVRQRGRGLGAHQPRLPGGVTKPASTEVATNGG